MAVTTSFHVLAQMGISLSLWYILYSVLKLCLVRCLLYSNGDMIKQRNSVQHSVERKQSMF